MKNECNKNCQFQMNRKSGFYDVQRKHFPSCRQNLKYRFCIVNWWYNKNICLDLMVSLGTLEFEEINVHVVNLAPKKERMKKSEILLN